ncbi:hypothetical protein PPERSA_07802 [Pseudocohnilembus persalinus]|uniref:Uncharacterized protein n=1 Tax=Pseudocohnilembus persalinus TaxID=266149 RepID=A0A0V0QBV7_PSEPJ|nr:hypothetical protein PPERSA_07802 [Pseudocohnilembus persalinus]|eukprot:KRW99725.1 hypothetical protein PPERSA_07802 [Pseudocohnilembus persalinus]
MEIQETERIKQINFYYKTLTIKQPIYHYNNNIESLKQVKDDPLNNYGSHLLPRFFKQHMLPKIEFSQMNYKKDADPLKKKEEDAKKRLSLKSFVNSQIPGFFENNQNNMNLQMLNNYHNPKYAQNTSYTQHQATTQILDKSIINNNSTTSQVQNNIQIQINPLQNDVIHESGAQSRTSLEMVQSIPKRQKINANQNSNKKLNFTINLQEQNKQRPNLNISHSQRKMEYSKQIQDKLKQQKLNLIYQKTTLVEQLQLARGIEYINQNLYHQAYFGIQQGKESEIIEIFDDTLFRIFDNFNTIYKINLSKKALYYMISSFLQTKDYIRPPFVSLQKQELQEPPTHMELKIYFLSQETLFFVQNKWIKQAQSSNQEYIQGNSQKRKEMLQMWKKKVNLKYVIDKIYNRDLVFFNQQMENYLLLKTEEELNQIRSIIDVQENQIHNIENNFLIDYLNKDFNKKNIDYDEIKPDMFYKRFKNQSKVDQVKEIEFRQGEFKLVNSKQRFQSQFIEQTIEQIKENNSNKEKKNQFLQ